MVNQKPTEDVNYDYRALLAKLDGVVAEAVRPVILIYGSPDPDALASAWALRELMRRQSKAARIRYSGEVGRLENQTMIESLRIPARPLRRADLKSADLVALVDCQPEFFGDQELPRCDIVFDHHPRKSSRQYAFSDIRPDCLSTSSILTEYLKAADVEPNRRLATALYYGIQTDVRHMQQPPMGVDGAALRFLEQKLNINLLRRIEFSSYSLERLDYFAVALIKLRYAKGVLYSHIGPVPHADICVQVADFLIRVKDAKWALVSGIAGTKLTVVFRCDGHRKHAGKTAEAAFGALGSAGGHRTMARAEVEFGSLPEGSRSMQNEMIERFVLDSLSKVDREFKTLRSLFADKEIV
jgi:nanoRNase/pAp phosphatase (c-di-AMP/oligoRNAs hydrolase)